MSSRHQFHLRWSNYGHNLANSFIKLFESESLADVTLFCDGESYRAHRVVLAASSVHFQELFEQCSGAQNLVVILDGTTPVNLRALLEFMYKGEVYVDDANLNTFLQTAKRLQVKGLSLSQSDLHSISSDVTEDQRQTGGDKLPTSFSATNNNAGSGENSVSVGQQNAGSLLMSQQTQQQQNQQNQQQQQSQSGGQGQQQNQATLNKTNSFQSPNTYSSPSPSPTPPNPPGPSGIYTDDKNRKKIRISASPRHQSPDGSIPDGVEYGQHPQHPPRPAAPIPSPSINTRIIEMEQRQNMMSGFPNFGPMYPSPGQGNLGPPPSPSHSQQLQQQQQTIVITENPNIRKIRSASTENTMPEDLSIKLESGREEEMTGLPGKQRSFSMDLSPSEAPFGGIGGGGGPGPQGMWSLPSPSSLTAQHPPPHDISPQSTADGKKLKCPFCERLYGYETNLRAHIRQRHQGIRVPCPFCTRIFTRNNTVRRHVAREHRALLGGVRAFHHPLNPDGGPMGPHSQHPPFGSPPGGSTTSSPSQGSPSTSTSASSSAGSGGNPNMGGGGGQIISGGQGGGGINMGQGQHLVVTSGGQVGHGGMMSNVMGMSAASVSAAIAASNCPSLPASIPPLSSSSVASGGQNNNRPNSRSSVGSGKPMD